MTLTIGTAEMERQKFISAFSYVERISLILHFHFSYSQLDESHRFPLSYIIRKIYHIKVRDLDFSSMMFSELLFPKTFGWMAAQKLLIQLFAVGLVWLKTSLNIHFFYFMWKMSCFKLQFSENNRLIFSKLTTLNTADK